MAFDLNIMDYPADFLRGWPTSPDSGNRESNRFKMAANVDSACGDLVVLNSSSELIKPVTGTLYANFGIIVRGTLDDKSVYKSKRPIVLWGNYLVRTTKFDASLNVGEHVVASAPADVGLVPQDGVFFPAANVTNANSGTCLQIIPGTGGQPSSAIIEVK